MARGFNIRYLTFVLILSLDKSYSSNLVSDRARVRHHVMSPHPLCIHPRANACYVNLRTPVKQSVLRSQHEASQYVPSFADIAYHYCLYSTRRCAYTRSYTTHVYIFFSFHSLISNDCHSLLRVARDSTQHFFSNHGHLLKHLLATPVTLCQGWQSGSNIRYWKSGQNVVPHRWTLSLLCWLVNEMATSAGVVAHMVERVLSMHEALGSIPSNSITYLLQSLFSFSSTGGFTPAWTPFCCFRASEAHAARASVDVTTLVWLFLCCFRV